MNFIKYICSLTKTIIKYFKCKFCGGKNDEPVLPVVPEEENEEVIETNSNVLETVVETPEIPVEPVVDAVEEVAETPVEPVVDVVEEVPETPVEPVVDVVEEVAETPVEPNTDDAVLVYGEDVGPTFEASNDNSSFMENSDEIEQTFNETTDENLFVPEIAVFSHEIETLVGTNDNIAPLLPQAYSDDTQEFITKMKNGDI
jgi:hypothetical protein